MTLRPPGPDDADAVTSLEQQCFGASAWSESAVAGALVAGDRRWCRVAEGSDGVVGYVIGVPAGDVLDLARVAVAPHARGAGWGGCLVDTLLTYAHDAVFDRVLLEVSAHNDAALRLYARHGFAEIDRRRDYYGTGDDAVVMQASPAPWRGEPDD